MLHDNPPGVTACTQHEYLVTHCDNGTSQYRHSCSEEDVNHSTCCSISIKPKPQYW